MAKDNKMDTALKVAKGIGFVFSALAALCTGIVYAGKFGKVLNEFKNIAEEVGED